MQLPYKKKRVGWIYVLDKGKTSYFQGKFA